MSGLFDPFDLRGLELGNRIVMAPLTRSRSGPNRIPNALMATYYAQRASAGLIISEATTVGEMANGWVETPGLYTQEQSEAWKPVVAAVHEKGGKIFAQLWHTGRASHSDFHGGKLPVAPSSIAIHNEEPRKTNLGPRPNDVPRALETSEISGVVAEYARAASFARDAGFDGVEIHGANGYLVDQFLQSKTNHRTDAYGGSIENRYRFLDEVTTAVIGVFGANRVGVRISPNGCFNDMGSPDYRETFLYVATRLDRFGLAYLHVVDGLAFGFHGLGEPMILSEFRKVFHGPLMGNCGYTREDAEARLRSGDADLIAFGRDFMSTPDLVERFRNNWPLNPPSDMGVWYSHGPEGYVDFPAYGQ
jgi:2,4-dienoyl-CoA reductase-like NADH-dependent reductase (Old Yellow Enzyme family)